MANPRIALDGTMAYGVTVGASGVVTIDAVAYKVNSVTPNRPLETARQTGPDGTPGQSRYTVGFDSCDMELQLATASTATPPFGATFSMTLDSAGYGAETWVCMRATAPQTNGPTDIRTITLSVEKVLNSITTVA